MERYSRDTKFSNVPHGETGSTRVTYTPRVDATVEGELAALATAYAFILRCHEEKKAAETSGDNEDMERGEEATPPGSTPRTGLNPPPREP